MGIENITEAKQKRFIHCGHCGSPLMEIRPNGTWYFRFGRRSEATNDPVVEMEIHGTVKIRCWRKTCGKVSILNFFNPNQPDIRVEEKPS